MFEGWGLPTRVAEPLAYVLVIGATTCLSVVIGELVPKNLALANPERIACVLAPPITVVARIAGPAVSLLDASTRAVFRLVGYQTGPAGAVTDEEIKTVAQGKHIVPTETGLSLFGVLKQADPVLVDPGVTAQLECLLDDVVVGKQEMVGAIDAVCDVAQRIIGKLKDSAAVGGAPSPGAAVGNGAAAHPPTPAMKRFADSLVRQKGIKPPPGYKTSISICRKFLNEHAPKRAESEMGGKLETKPVSPAQLLYAKKIAQGKGLPSFPTRPRPARPRCLRRFIRTETPSSRRGRKAAYKSAGSSVASIGGADKEVSEAQSWGRCRSPSVPSGPSMTKPGPSVAISNRMPFGSRK